jgi:hypothetical protein
MDYMKTNAESRDMTWTNTMGVYHGINTPYRHFSLCEVIYDRKMLVFNIYMAVLLRIQVF